MTQGPNARAGGLLERELELGILERSVEAASHGEGGVVVVEGPAGIGKTSLLARAREFATTAGMRVVSARGAELERRFPFGVVRQFFESFLFTVPAGERPRWLRETSGMAAKMFGSEHLHDPANEFDVLHSLYWMCVNIADERPLMMVLDDAQWADVGSLGFVEFTCRRLEQVPFVLAIGTRVPDGQAPAPLITLLAEPSVRLLRPSPLSVAAVRELVRATVDPRADAAFAAACHEVTTGNPFLLRELMHEVLDERVPATAAAAARVREIGPRGVARVVLLRLARLPEEARRMAAALSVAGDDLTLRELGELAELGESVAASTSAGLEIAGIVQDATHFTHPVVRAAIYGDLPAAARSTLHRRVAELKASQGRPAEEVATHLLGVEPGSVPGAMETLREAASRAASAGDHVTAERLLERALREPVDPAGRAEMLAELGSAEARTGNPAGAHHLQDAARRISDPDRSATASIELANVLKFSLQADRAAEVLADALERVPPGHPELERRLRAELLGTRFISPLTQERIRSELDSLALPASGPHDLLDACLLAAAAFDAVAALGPAVDAIVLGRRALSGDAIPPDLALGGQALIFVTVALIWSEDFTDVHRRLSEDLAAARASGSPLGIGNLSTMRAMCNYRCGRLLDAESDASTTIELAREVTGLETLLPPAVAYAVLSGIERDADLSQLHELAADPGLDRAPQLLPYTQLAWARGELALAREDPEQALAHFMSCDRPEPGYGGPNPSMVAWREGAALARLRLGDRDAARRLAREAVTRASRFGAPRARGVSLRAAALVEDGEARIEGLSRAVEVLADADAALELARARCDLGATLRAAGQRTHAQAVLVGAHELAGRIGATRLARRAAEELTAAGVRPRRELLGERPR